MSEAIDIRILDNSDRQAFEDFLKDHRDSSMFLRSNALRVGLEFRDAPLHALFTGAIEGERITGVVAHGWNGMVMLQCPGEITELARNCISWSGRKVTGFIGPANQVRRARLALGLADAPTNMDEEEWLYALDLSDIKIPVALQNGEIVCRAPLPEELQRLHQWRIA